MGQMRVLSISFFICVSWVFTDLHGQAIDIGTGGGEDTSSPGGRPVIPFPGDYGSLTLSRAGSAVAADSGIDSVSLNPAGMMFQSGRGAFGGGYFEAPGNVQRWDIGIIDGRKPVIGGLRYDYTEKDSVDRQGIHAGVAYRHRLGAIGATFSSYHFSGLTRNNGWHFSQSLGVLAPVAYGLTLAISGQNFVDKAPDTLLNPTMSFGLAYQKPAAFKFSFQADRKFNLSDQDFNYSFSTEVYMQQFFVLRSGFRWDHSNDPSYFTAGGGIEAPKLQINAFYVRNIEKGQAQGFGGHLLYFF